MKQLTICSGSDLINNCGFKIDHDCSWNVFATGRLTEESLWRIIWWHGFWVSELSIRRDSML